MDYTNVYRYIVLHEISKPKHNMVKDIIGGSGNAANQKARKDGPNQNKKLTNQQSLPENDDFYSNDPKIILLYDQDEKNKKRALKEITREMYRDVIIKIEEENQTKNQPVQSQKISTEIHQSWYNELNQRLYQTTKRQLDKTKNGLFKYNNSKTLSKLEEARKQVDTDFQHIQKQTKAFMGLYQDMKTKNPSSFLPSIQKNNSDNNQQKSQFTMENNGRTQTRTSKNGVNVTYGDNTLPGDSSLSIINKSPTKFNPHRKLEQSDYQTLTDQAADLDDFQLTQDQIGNKFIKDLDVLAENSDESSKLLFGNQFNKSAFKIHLSLNDYIKEMEKKSFYFRQLAQTSSGVKPQQQFIDMINQQNSFKNADGVNHISKFRVIAKELSLEKQDIYYLIYNYKHFQQVQIINLSNNYLKDYAGFVLLNVLNNYAPNLLTLNLKNTGIGLESIKAGRDFLSSSSCKLEVMNLSGNRLEDTAFCELCVGISQNFSLKALDFSSNRITHISMKIFNSIIKYSRILQEVDLSHNALQNESIDIISKNLGRNKGIQILRLSDTMIDDQSAKNLFHMLFHNKFMKSLDLSDNNFSNEGFKEILVALEKNDQLIHLNFNGNMRIDWSALKLIRNTQSKLSIKKNSPDEFVWESLKVQSFLQEQNAN
eukprot:403340999